MFVIGMLGLGLGLIGCHYITEGKFRKGVSLFFTGLFIMLCLGTDIDPKQAPEQFVDQELANRETMRMIIGE